MLAQALKVAPCELRADFQQYYGLNIDGMGDAFSLPHAACLAAQLPADSRTVKELLGPELAEAVLWTLPVRIAAEQLNEMRIMRWLNSQDGYEGRNYPEMLLPPEVREAPPREPDADGYKAALAEIRKKINESNGGEVCPEQ